MIKKTKQNFPEPQNPLILRCHRLMETFAKSDDERDFYLDRIEGFIIFVDLDKTDKELKILDEELKSHPDRYCVIPKLTFFETKKIMEGFVNEKVYDIDTKEKLSEIIQSKEARAHFLDYIYDQDSELEKWQLYYQERSRIRIIEWLRKNNFQFVFEEDLELSTNILETLKKHLFDKKVGQEVVVARKTITSRAKTYYSSEALNPRPKRGRPPKQVQKLENDLQISTDLYITVPKEVMPFLFIPEITNASDVTFSTTFETGDEILAQKRHAVSLTPMEDSLDSINAKLTALRELSSHWEKNETENILKNTARPPKAKPEAFSEFNEEERELFKRLEERKKNVKSTTTTKPKLKEKEVKKIYKPIVLKTKTIMKKKVEKPKKASTTKPAKKRIIPQIKKKPVKITKKKPLRKLKKTKPPAAKPEKKSSKKMKTLKRITPRKQKPSKPLKN